MNFTFFVVVIFLFSNGLCLYSNSGKFQIRLKRGDDGSYLTNSGGPVASGSKNKSQSQGKPSPQAATNPNNPPNPNSCKEVLRWKRDEGSYLTNSGGPVASGTKAPSKSGTSSNGNSQSPNSVSDSDPDVIICEEDNTANELPFRKTAKNANQLPMRKTARRRRIIRKKQAKKQQDVPAQQEQQQQEQQQPQFNGFLDKFGKKYDPTQSLVRKDIFAKNFDSVNVLNSQRKSPSAASVGMTKYSDLSSLEFKKKLGGAFLPNAGETKKITGNQDTKAKLEKCPAVDWVSYGIVPKVREQVECGSCYAMSTVDLLATQMMVDNKSWNKNVALSPQHVLDCFQTPAAEGCKGGRPKKVVEKMSQCAFNCQIPLESCYPYQDKQGTCNMGAKCADAPDLKVKYSELVDIDGPDEKEVMASLLQWGPVLVIVGLCDVWQFYNGTGIIMADQCTEKGNHAVLVTGYDYSHQVPYYTIKNSWGSDWGDSGYVRLEAGKNSCDVAKSVLVTCTSNCDTKTDIQSILKTTNYPKCSKR